MLANRRVIGLRRFATIATPSRSSPVPQFDPNRFRDRPLDAEIIVAEAVDEVDVFGPGPQPRLGIIHIMLWTAGVAIALSAYLATREIYQYNRDEYPFMQVLQVGHSLVSGAGLACLAVFLGRKWRGIPFPVHPGHWLLLMSGIISAIHLPVRGAILFALGTPLGIAGELHRFQAEMGIRGTALGAGALAWFFVALRFRTNTRWTCFFGVLAAADALMGSIYGLVAIGNFRIWEIAYSVEALCALCVPAYLLVVALRDLSAGARRDWLHWTGLAAVAAAMALYCLWYVWYGILMQPTY